MNTGFLCGKMKTSGIRAKFTQPCGYTKNQYTVHFQRVNILVYELYLN